jgi:hypothetical protein
MRKLNMGSTSIKLVCFLMLFIMLPVLSVFVNPSSSFAAVNPTLSVTNSPVTYNGSPQAATVTGNVTGIVTNVKYNGSSTVPTSAGTYAITADFVPTDITNYNILAGASAGNFVILKATPTLSVTNSPVTYNGFAQAAIVTAGSVPGTVSNIKYGGSLTQPTNVGTYGITADFAPNNATNYNTLTDAPAGFFTIQKATPTLSVTNSPVTYNGSQQAAIVTSSVPGDVTNIEYDGSSTVPTDAGTYAITADFAPTDTSNYNPLTGASAGNFVIQTGTSPTLSVTNSPVTYDGSQHAAIVTGSVAGTVSNIEYNGSSTAPTDAGTYAITADFAPTDTNNNTLSGASAGNFVIQKATPTLSVTNSPVTYTGYAQAAIVTGSVDGIVSNIKYGGSITAPTNVGTYGITADFAPTDPTNYNTLSGASAGNFVILKATSPTINWSNPPDIYYGTALGATQLNATATNPNNSAPVPGTFTYTPPAGTVLGAGSAQTLHVDFAPYDTGNYGNASKDVQINVLPRAITVTANPQTKVYGEADPPLTYSITTGSLVGSDAFTGNLTRSAGETVGNYTINQGTLALSTNYNLSYVSAQLEITKRPITVTADHQSKAYGQPDPPLTYTITSGSLAFSDAFTGNLTRTAGETVGNYTISQGTLALNSNYSLSFVSGIFTIAVKAPLITWSNPADIIYGTALDSTQLNATASDATASVPGNFTYTPPAGTVLSAGNNTLHVDFVPEDTLNYSDASKDVTINVTPLDIQVTADAQTKVYGQPDPSLTYQITSSSLVGNDTFTGNLTRTAGEDVGNYTINQGTLALNSSYNLSYVGATLQITQRPIRVTADAKTKVYGQPDPPLTYKITSGSLVGNDTFTGNLTRAAGESWGTYAITQGTLALNSNYNLTFIGAVLTIASTAPSAGGGGGGGAYLPTTPIPTPTPTGTPVSTVTPSPTPQTTSSPTPSVSPTPTPSLTPAPTPLELTIGVDTNGVVQQAMELTSPDGLIKIQIASGVIALTAEGTPLTTIQVQSDKQPPEPPSGFQTVGPVYDLGPQGATFNPYIILGLVYDPGLYPDEASQHNLAIAYFDAQTGKWVNFNSVVDTTNHIVTAEVQHLTTFAILGPQSSNRVGVSWSLIISIIGGLAVLGVLFQQLLVRRAKQRAAWRWNGTDWIPPQRKPGKDWYWNGKEWVRPKE